MIIVLNAARPEDGVADQISDAEHEHGLKMLENLDPLPDGWICAVPTEVSCNWSGDGGPCPNIGDYLVLYSDRRTRCVYVSVCEHHAHCIMSAVPSYHERKGALTPEAIAAMWADMNKEGST